MAVLDKTTDVVKREIALVNVTGLTAAQIQTTYNTNFGQIGWRIVQAVVLGANTFIIAERVL